MLEMVMGMGAGLLGGALSGLFGIGGGIVLVPLLGLILRIPQHEAQGLSLAALVLPNSLPAVLAYRRQGVHVPWRWIPVMALGFLGGILVGALAANRLSDPVLRIGFAGFMLAMAVRLYRTRPPQAAEEREAEPAAWRFLLVGLAGGLASGLLGIGGGLVMIPLMVAWLGLGQRRAQLASLSLMLLPLGLPGVWVYVSHGRPLPWMVLGGVVLGFLAGGALGARGAARVRETHLAKAFAVFLGLMALGMLRAGLR